MPLSFLFRVGEAYTPGSEKGREGGREGGIKRRRKGGREGKDVPVTKCTPFLLI